MEEKYYIYLEGVISTHTYTKTFHSMWFDKQTTVTLFFWQEASLKGVFIQMFHDALNPGETWFHTDCTRLLSHQTETAGKY